jgi:hypothetical protein
LDLGCTPPDTRQNGAIHDTIRAGYLIEVGQSTGLLHGHLAAKRAEDLPG